MKREYQKPTLTRRELLSSVTAQELSGVPDTED